MNMNMKIIIAAIAEAGGCLLCGCIGFSKTSKIDDGAVYELNREMYIAEADGLLLVDSRTEHPEYYTIKGTLPAGTKLQESIAMSRRGWSLWFGHSSNVAVYGEILGGDFKGHLVGFGDYRQRCPKHGYWYLCPLIVPATKGIDFNRKERIARKDRNLTCIL